MLISSRSASNQLQKSSFATQEGNARLLLRQVLLYLWLMHPFQTETSSKQGCENICQVGVYRRICVSMRVRLECLDSISEGERQTLTLETRVKVLICVLGCAFHFPRYSKGHFVL